MRAMKPGCKARMPERVGDGNRELKNELALPHQVMGMLYLLPNSGPSFEQGEVAPEELFWMLRRTDPESVGRS